MAPSSPHIVIVGCGFAGLEAARTLRHAPVEVTVVDRTNHHLFQPLLYQVATAGLSAPDIAAPVRHLFRNQPNVTTLMAEVNAIDAAARQVGLADGPCLPYDHLIVAAGGANSYFGHDEWALHAPGLKTLDDAFEIRRRILLAFESAERDTDPVARGACLTFVVIGGGATGVEMAGTVAEIARHTLPGEFRRIDPSRARILLLEGGPRLLPSLPQELGHSARDQLQRLGVEVRLGARVTCIRAGGVDVQSAGSSSEHIASRCTIWAAGVRAAAIGRQLALATGAATDRTGRIIVEPDLSVPGHPEISVVGDLAAALSHADGAPPQPVPAVSPAAKQMGRAAALNVLRRLQSRPTVAFRYRDHGTVAAIGRNAAVVNLPLARGHLRFGGFFAWLFWLFAHIYFLIGFRNRLAVLADWAWAYWTRQRYARVIAGTEPVRRIE
jgi:NADH:ubiquinone reductase (H+-translocating)